MLSWRVRAPFLLVMLVLSSFGLTVPTVSSQQCALDIALVLDHSGSMDDEISGRRKIDVLEEATRGFIQNAPTSSDWAIAILEFADDVNVRAGLTLIQSSQDRDQIANTITTIADGGTNIAKAIIAASGLLSESARTTTRKIMILLSDGEPSVTGKTSDLARTETLEAAENAKKNGLLIITAGVGLTAETSNLMSSISTDPDYFINAASSIALIGWFKSRSADICTITAKCRVTQIATLLENAGHNAIGASRFNIEEGTDVAAEILFDIASYLATLGFEKALQIGLKIRFEKLRKETQAVIQIVENKLPDLVQSNTESAARSLTLQIGRLYADQIQEPAALDISLLQGIYDGHIRAFRIELNDLISNDRCPDIDYEYWSRLVEDYAVSVEASKQGASFYISLSSIGTLGQAAEAKRWWNSPFRDVSDYGLLALQIAYIFVMPQAELIPMLMDAAVQLKEASVFVTVLQRIVEENVLMYQDYFRLIHAILSALKDPDMYALPAGKIASVICPPVSLLSPIGTVGPAGILGRIGTVRLVYDYSWPIPMGATASLALFDQSGKLDSYTVGSSKALSSSGQTTLEVNYLYPGLRYALKPSPYNKMKFELFVHNVDPSLSRHYLLGPIRGELEVSLLPGTNVCVSVGSDVKLMLIDPRGLRIGAGLDDGMWRTYEDVPGAWYSGLESHPQYVVAPAEGSELYRAVVTGNSSGAYVLNATLRVGGNITSAHTLAGYVERAGSLEHKILIVVEDGSTAIDPSLINVVWHTERLPIVCGLVTSLVVGAVVAVRRRESRKRPKIRGVSRFLSRRPPETENRPRILEIRQLEDRESKH